MAITKTSYVERVLIVLNPDGTLKGAHSQTLDAIVEDGVVLKESQGDAVPVDAASLASVLPDQASLVAQVQALTADRDAHDAEKAALQAEIDALKPPADENGVPQEVSMYQARAALIGAGLYDQVNAAVLASSDEIVKVAWEYATVVKRSSPFITAMSGAIGLDDAAVDQLFVTASQVN